MLTTSMKNGLYVPLNRSSAVISSFTSALQACMNHASCVLYDLEVWIAACLHACQKHDKSLLKQILKVSCVWSDYFSGCDLSQWAEATGDDFKWIFASLFSRIWMFRTLKVKERKYIILVKHVNLLWFSSRFLFHMNFFHCFVNLW